LQTEFGDIDNLNVLGLHNNTRKDPKYYKDIDGSNISIDIVGTDSGVTPWVYGDGTYEEGKSYGIKKYNDAFQQYCNDDDKQYNLFNDLYGYENTHKVLNYSKLNTSAKF
jgi:hypothetical protein